jgi:hypothetical protein
MSFIIDDVGKMWITRQTTDDNITRLMSFALTWHDAGRQAALEGACQEKTAKSLD